MTLAYVQSIGAANPTGSVSTLSATFASPVTAGNLLVAVVSYRGGNSVSIKDSVNAVNFTLAGTDAPADVVSIFYYVAPTGGTMSITATFSVACTPSIDILEFGLSGGNVVVVDGPVATANGNSTTGATAAMTLSGTDLVIVGNSDNQITTATAGSGFTLDYQATFSSGNADGLVVEYATSQTTSVTPTMTFSPGIFWAIAAVAFKSVPPTPLISLTVSVAGDGTNNYLVVGTANPANTAASNVTAVAASPTLFVNGTAASLGPATWTNSVQDTPFAMWKISSPAQVANLSPTSQIRKARRVKWRGAPGSVSTPTIKPTDTLTYSYALNGISTALGGNLAVAVQPVTNAINGFPSVPGGITPFGGTKTMKLGVNLDNGAWNSQQTQRHSANLALCLGFVATSGTTLTYDSADPTLPATWTPTTGTIHAALANYANKNGIEDPVTLAGTVSVTGSGPTITFTNSQTLTAANTIAFAGDSSAGAYHVTNPGTGTVFTITPSYGGTTNGTASASLIGQLGYPVMPGTYAFQWTDANAGTAAEMQLALFGDSNVCATGSSGNVETGTTRVHGVRSISGNTITITYANVAFKSTTNPNHGYNMGLTVYLSSTLGQFSDNLGINGGPITNFIGVGPGDTLAAVQANPLVISNLFKASLTAPNGNGPAIVRALNPTAINGYTNFQDYADCQRIGMFSYVIGQKRTFAVTAARRYSTDPTNPIVSWSSTRVYNKKLGFDGTDPSLGPYLDLTLRAGASTNNGELVNPFPGGGTYAAVEFVTSASHGLRTGDLVTSLVGGATSPYLFPITGLTSPATLAGTATISNNGNSVTFSQSQTISAPLQFFVFSGDGSGAAYQLATGTGTTFAISPNYQGTNTTTAVATQTAVADISNFSRDVVVTSATTFVVAMGDNFGITAGATAIQKISSTVQIPMSVNFSTAVIGGTAPYGFYPSIAANWPGCKVQVPLMLYMSDACLRSIADEMATYGAVNAEFIYELHDEVWNNSFPGLFPTQVFGNLVGLCPPNTNISTGGSGTVFYATPSNPVGLDKYAAYPLIMAHMRYVIQTQLDTHGKGQKASLAIGGFLVSSSYLQTAVNFCNANNIPFDYGMIAPYMNGPPVASGANSTWATAATTWPITLVSAMFNLYNKCSSTLWLEYSSNYAAMQSYTVAGPTPQFIGYEGGVQGVTTSFPTNHDVYYHRSFPNACYAAWGCQQDGSQLVPGSGLQFVSLYTFGSQWGNATSLGDLWSIQIYQGQLAADGTGNVGTTDQFTGVTGSGNGLCNDFVNGIGGGAGAGSPALLALQTWFGVTNNGTGGSISFTISPLIVLSNQASPFALTLVGTGTGWTNSSVVTINNSVTGTTTVMNAGFTANSTTSATLQVTSGVGSGTFTVTVDGVTSTTLTVPPASIRVSPSRVPANETSPFTLMLIGSGTNWISGSAISIQNSITGTTTVTKGTWIVASADLATLSVTTGAGSGTWTITIDGVVSPILAVGNKKHGYFGGMFRLPRVGR